LSIAPGTFQALAFKWLRGDARRKVIPDMTDFEQQVVMEFAFWLDATPYDSNCDTLEQLRRKIAEMETQLNAIRRIVA
jgi:hypothetical protein